MTVVESVVLGNVVPFGRVVSAVLRNVKVNRDGVGVVCTVESATSVEVVEAGDVVETVETISVEVVGMGPVTVVSLSGGVSIVSMEGRNGTVKTVASTTANTKTAASIPCHRLLRTCGKSHSCFSSNEDIHCGQKCASLFSCVPQNGHAFITYYPNVSNSYSKSMALISTTDNCLQMPYTTTQSNGCLAYSSG